MAQRTEYLDGEPCWADVTTPDPDAARRFYGTVLGWDFVDTGAEFGHYTLCLAGGHRVAALTPVPPDDAVAPAWTVYLASGDVAGTARAIDAGGGKILMGPTPLPENGSMLAAVDPTGAAFGVWQGAERAGSELYGDAGAMCWAEVNTRQPAEADTFYRGLFGYRQEQIGDGVTFDYTAWMVPGGEAMVCGRLTLADDQTAIGPSWMVYFAVDDADAAAERVVAAGGEVWHPAFDSTNGRLTIVADPHGAPFTLIDQSRRIQLG